MKTKKKLAWLLSFALMIAAVMSQITMPVRAESTNVSFDLGITIANGTTPPQSYGVSYQVVDSNGASVGSEGYSGYVGSSTPDNNPVHISYTELDSSYQIKFTVESAGLSIRLDGSDVTNEGWSEGKTIPVSDLNDNYSFELFRTATSEDDPPQGPENQFDGIAYFVWRGADDALCTHKITGLDASRSQGEIIAFDIIYIPVSDVKDDVTGEQFVIGNENYFWMWSEAEQFINENNSSYTAFANALDEIWDTPEFRGLAIDPCGAENGNSTVCTNGNREFRATIYDDTKFEGVAFSQNEDDYTYFPKFWDNVFFTNTVDISNSTAEEPAVYEAFLLEPTIHFEKADNSVYEFIGIRALNVPDNAVTITGNAVDGYDIEFGSNFFDNIVFEISTSGGNYYLEIARIAIQAFDVNGPGMENPMVVAEAYYNSDESYSDYEVYATIHYKDGSISIQKMTVSEITDDGFGNPMPAGTYEMEAGKGLKCAQYTVPLTDDIEGIDFNAVKSGALSGESYGGSYFGSGSGVYYDIENRRIIY